MSDLVSRLVTYRSEDEWRADRRPGDFGATTLCAVRGEYFHGPWTVWANVHAPHLLPERRTTEDMRFGTLWEPRIATVMAHVQGYELRRPLCRVPHPEAPWFRPSPDGFVSRDGDLGICEIKALRSRAGWGPDGIVIDRYSEDAEEGVEPYILTQCYANMEASGLEFAILWVGFGFQDVRTYTILRDEDHQRALLEQAREWRSRHLIGGEIPEYDGSKECRIYLGREAHREGQRKPTEEELRLVLEYAEAHAQSKDADARKSAAYTALVPLMNADKTKTLIINQPGKSPGRFTVGTDGRPRLTNL